MSNRQRPRARQHQRQRRHETFRCGHCNVDVPLDAPGTAHRNHCPNCLWSRHLDDDVPGDRDADCGSTMEPIAITAASRRRMAARAPLPRVWCAPPQPHRGRRQPAPAPATRGTPAGTAPVPARSTEGNLKRGSHIRASWCARHESTRPLADRRVARHAGVARLHVFSPSHHLPGCRVRPEVSSGRERVLGPAVRRAGAVAPRSRVGAATSASCAARRSPRGSSRSRSSTTTAGLVCASGSRIDATIRAQAWRCSSRSRSSPGSSGTASGSEARRARRRACRPTPPRPAPHRRRARPRRRAHRRTHASRCTLPARSRIRVWWSSPTVRGSSTQSKQSAVPRPTAMSIG